ncbi:uncharacterized protein RCC_02353 [Ramularia collo-cygni]|uniref:DUF1857-domain-containing protein n=1 Tax=Ramularia collo-cygni TaxID=112498 RepID=A0A2D3UZ65_9PEZI|nr:uncharacterized protein RCC_02353 [Ramularia collo-cygni]CZT16516.1 uncharacterized protein RCC_02353 [Ramularia collo-cygni]
MPAFRYNVGYTARVNPTGIPAGDRLTKTELWQGVKRGARFPGDFAEHVQRCTVLSGSGDNFVREIVIGKHGVHAAEGTAMIQDVALVDGLYLLATTRGSGAKTTMMVTYGCGEADLDAQENDPHLTLFYELVMDENESPAAGSDEAKGIISGYRELAKRIVGESIDLIRAWKKSGRLAELVAQETSEVKLNGSK